MITVIGFNTAIDRLIRLDALRPGEVSRALDEQAYPGGKGLHVAQTIAALGERVQLVGLVDPAHRNMIGRLLCERGVVFHGIEVAESLRTCIALQDADGQVTEILGQGPLLDGAQQEALLRAFRRGVDDSELIVLSGSLPRGFPSTTYAELAAHVRDAGKRCLIDAGGELLQHAAQTRPFLVKPNRDEIADLLGRPIGDLAAAVDAVRELRADGIAMPVVTMGALGAVAADASGVWHALIELEQVRNTVGSGDCLLAGMTVGMARNMNLEGILRLGVACGSANAQGQETGFVERRAVETLLAKVRVQRLA
ncbi:MULTISPECIES: 1-phosphofructokinase family hexose kinase [Rhodanobacter]|uniref:Phosphofructokinase n=2 Tax=Rhodanobacter TaxID=75309 RepID=I4W3Y7_9GAMM|nr:1-phosphofructokinase family hexose kinase [Rhodanobacter spathiphylli]EIL94178.1 1-phosphofructokinase [Rhodanobacter spathiphylli B39]